MIWFVYSSISKFIQIMVFVSLRPAPSNNSSNSIINSIIIIASSSILEEADIASAAELSMVAESSLTSGGAKWGWPKCGWQH